MQPGAPTPLPPDEAEQLYQLALELLCDLVRLDTTNPPGNEIIAAQYLAERFQAEGLKPEVVEPAPGRGNVVVRLKADGKPAEEAGAEGLPPGLLLLSHLDVVPAEPEHWQVPPFSAEIKDGYVWGRGTLDTKGLTAFEAAVLIWAKRKGVPLARDIVFAATANEESGGGWGAHWLAQNRLDLIAADAAINEGGGVALNLAGRLVYTIQTAEKAPCPVTIRAKGRPGHASVPTDDNAVVQLSRALVAIGSRRLPVHITDTYRQLVTSMAQSIGGVVGAMAETSQQAGRHGHRQGGRRPDQGRGDARDDPQHSHTHGRPSGVQDQRDSRRGDRSDRLQIAPRIRAHRDPCRAECGRCRAGLRGAVELEASPVAAPSAESAFDHPLIAHIQAAIGTNHSQFTRGAAVDFGSDGRAPSAAQGHSNVRVFAYAAVRSTTPPQSQRAALACDRSVCSADALGCCDGVLCGKR